MRFPGAYAGVVVLVLTAMTQPAALAQAPTAPLSRPSSGARDSLVAGDAPQRGLAGRTRVAFDASAARLDHGVMTTYGVAMAAIPFLGEHVQIGVTEIYAHSKFMGGGPVQNATTALIANYVFDGGSRWRGYVGGFGSIATQPHGSSVQTGGVQGGALFFVTPAVALRGELRYREATAPDGRRYGTAVAVVTLDPYVSGAANGAPTPAGLGVLDLALTVSHARYPTYHASGISATIAPYLARWAQVGVEGQAVRFSDFGGTTAYRVRGFGRGYLPLTVRTQPFVEGFAESSTYNGNDGGLTDYGGAFGVRQMLNANVALDLGVRRTLEARQTFGSAGSSVSFRSPGTTALIAGVTTRLGRAR